MPKRSFDGESFTRMRPPGGKNRRGRAVVGEHKLDHCTLGWMVDILQAEVDLALHQLNRFALQSGGQS